MVSVFYGLRTIKYKIMESLIKELNELQATLKADGYKDWCYAQLTIDKAIKAVKNCNIPPVVSTLQWCYNYINKQKESDEKTALIKHLIECGVS